MTNTKLVLVNEKCWDLAECFLSDRKLPDAEKLASDTQSLAEAIQEAVEDWFYANPIKTTGG